MNKLPMPFIVYVADLIPIYHVSLTGAKYRYSRIKKNFGLKRGQYITTAHLASYIGSSEEAIVRVIQENRKK
ncbi:hypothetical protein Pedsa_0572 [Pseudopedobacter saltans DSM 12145]|uniref:Uncharacterized protein n=1 Tax=Pseudopedobacter saltans (strain ATCC 51119 / DSM 12145 / JCM 21818 / CCUG 39354 / LMG 10337 / NBRC 100064 / NCIMB 13643) TaxID=762903 RepID=F0S7C6_PSESL|nr:hypothetical protein [Pseudopedobacter saltans]ADY51151.1 hypothetical protein Pedsa_0572 [Pseudopedobacter saltans DSM 12145]